MGDEPDRTPPELTEEQGRVLDQAEGSLLALGAAGCGRTEALAHRIARLAGGREGVLALTCSHAGAARLRGRAEEAIAVPFEEIACQPHRVAATRLLSDYPEEAGLDPFIEQLGGAERLALLLDRLRRAAPAPPRDPRQPRRAAGQDGGPDRRAQGRRGDRRPVQGLGREAGRGRRRPGRRRRRRARARVRRLYEMHDAIVRDAGAIDGGEAVLELTRLLAERPALASAIASRFPTWSSTSSRTPARPSSS